MFKKNYFVLCPSYHGATLLSTMLNSHPAISSLGDTYPSNKFDQICGCGKKVSNCDFWQSIKSEIKASRFINYSSILPRYPLERKMGLSQRMQSRFVALLASPGAFRKFCSELELNDFKADYDLFNRAVYHNLEEPGSVFVDGVKSVARVHALEASGFHIDGIIHLTRSSIDYVSSARKNSYNRFGSTLYHAMNYRLYHKAVEKLGRDRPVLSVSYEDLCDSPELVMKNLFLFLGVEPRSVGDLLENRHNIWHFMGNSSLFKFDKRLVRRKHDLPLGQKIVVTKVTGVC